MHHADKNELNRLGRLTAGMLTQNRLQREKTEARFQRVEQAILERDAQVRELATALRAAGLLTDGGVGSLPSPSEALRPAAPSADTSARISA